ncbi:MAG: hypothetical protein ABII74_02340 [Elusimicrobiota bacterium]
MKKKYKEIEIDQRTFDLLKDLDRLPPNRRQGSRRNMERRSSVVTEGVHPEAKQRQGERRSLDQRSIVITLLISSDILSVYNFLKTPENLRSLPKVKKYDQTEISPVEAIVDGTIDMEGVDVEMQLKLNYDDKNYTINFERLSGDMEIFEGYCKLLQEPQGTKMEFIVDLSWGLPNIEMYIGHTLKEKTKLIIKDILSQIKP